MLLPFNLGAEFRIEKMMEDGLDQVHEKEQMFGSCSAGSQQRYNYCSLYLEGKMQHTAPSKKARKMSSGGSNETAL